jgi:hypothetical protein
MLKFLGNEIVSFYASVKKFVIAFFSAFYDHSGKLSWKRISSASALFIGIRQIIIAPNDHFGILVCFVYALVIMVIAAITNS